MKLMAQMKAYGMPIQGVSPCLLQNSPSQIISLTTDVTMVLDVVEFSTGTGSLILLMLHGHPRGLVTKKNRCQMSTSRMF